MYGSGVLTYGIRIIIMLLTVEMSLGYKMEKKASGWFVAGLGSTTSMTTAAWLTGTNPWSLLPFYPLVFVAFVLCREAVDFFLKASLPQLHTPRIIIPSKLKPLFPPARHLLWVKNKRMFRQ
jgi:hypothetical protein